ncbi:MauE/DoxX family redox-associated membrane protein [Catenulispora subtropica]|uniref:Methylamine utilisation protein MauE domain-containing protein n=1 Tax=Catenulispora subtropica TaxID=450798 RepID=A0ABP5EQ74_9ACTN
MVYLSVACRALLAAVFGVAALGKLRGPAAFHAFVATLDGLRWLPPRLRTPAGATLAATEALAAVLLATPGAGIPALVLATALICGFVAVVAAAVVGDTSLTCRCFGGAGNGPGGADAVGPAHLIRNLLLAVIAVGGLVASAGFPGTAAGPGLVGAIGGGALTGALLTRWDDLRFLLGGR